MTTTKPLTPQQEKFAQEVVSGKSLSDAYRASYKVGKMTTKTINEAACRLAADSKVSARIKELSQAVAQETVLEAAGILKEIHRLASSDIGRIIDPATGRVLLPHELDADTRAAVASFEIDEYGRIKYKFWDKNSALERASKIRGLFELDNKQKVDPLAALLDGLQGKVLGPVKDEDDDGEFEDE